MKKNNRLTVDSLVNILNVSDAFSLWQYCTVEFSRFVPAADRIKYITGMMDAVRNDNKIKGYVWIVETAQTMDVTITIMVW